MLNRIKEIKGGVLNKSEFSKRFEGQGSYAEHIDDIFALYFKKYVLNQTSVDITTFCFTRNTEQKALF